MMIIESTSAGVKTAATIRMITITARRLRVKRARGTIPVYIKNSNTSGN